jgi:hypothetical protein
MKDSRLNFIRRNYNFLREDLIGLKISGSLSIEILTPLRVILSNV